MPLAAIPVPPLVLAEQVNRPASLLALLVALWALSQVADFGYLTARRRRR